MKKFMRFISIALTLAMVIACFAACGNSGSAEKLVIGATGPLTGDVSSYGISVKQGAQLAVEEINAAGGINGILIDFLMKDDKAGPAEAATAYDQLMDAGMKVSLASVTSGACESFASKAVEDNLFYITPSASAAEVIANRKNGFRICFGDPDQGVLAADQLVNEYKFTKIGCIYDTSDTYSSGIYEAFKGEMEKLNVSFITKTFDKETNKDFSTQVEALKDCQVIFLPFYYTEAGLVARTCASKGVKAMLFGCDGLDGVAGQIDASVTNEIKYITPFDVNSTNTNVSDFVKKYTEKYNTAPDQFAADGYDAIYVIAKCLEKAEFNDVTMSVSDICDLLIDTITKDFTFEGVTGTVTWNTEGVPTKTLQIVTVGK